MRLDLPSSRSSASLQWLNASLLGSHCWRWYGAETCRQWSNFQCLTPRNKKQVRSFLGPTGYYCWVTPDYASIAVPLINLTRKSAPNLVKWDSDCNREDQRVAMHIYREFVRLRLELRLYWARLMMKARIIQQRISAGSNSPGNNATLQLRKNAWHSNHLCNLFSRANIFQMDYPDGNGSS